MSLRTFDFTMDGEPILLDQKEEKVQARGREMTWQQSEIFVDEGRELLKNMSEVPDSKWRARALRVVHDSLTGAGHEISLDELKQQFGMRTIYAMHDQVLIDAGLKPKGTIAGEIQAATPKTVSISANSAAA